MRTALLLGLVTLFASTSVVACVVEEEGAPSRRPKKSTTAKDNADDEEEEVDSANGDDPSVGSTEFQSGNPNATSTPTAPTTPDKPAQGFALALDNPTPTSDLGDEATINVTIQPKNGFDQVVNVAVTGLPAGVTAAPASGKPGTPIAIKLQTAVGAQVTPKDGSVPLVVTGTAGTEKAIANANFKVLPKVEVHIPLNARALAKAGQTVSYGAAFNAGGATPMKTQAGNPIELRIFNDDNAGGYTVHFGGALGHGNTAAPIAAGAYEIANGQPRVRLLNPGTNQTGYLHGEAQGPSTFRLQVQ